MPLIRKGCLKVMVSRRERMVMRAVLCRQFCADAIIVHRLPCALLRPISYRFLTGWRVGRIIARLALYPAAFIAILRMVRRNKFQEIDRPGWPRDLAGSGQLSSVTSTAARKPCRPAR